MTRRLLAPLAVVCLVGAAGCVDLTEIPVTGITSAYYRTPSGFESAVNAMYTPMRTHWALERSATMTVFGTDEFQKGADGSYKFFNDYTAQLTGDVDSSRTRGRISSGSTRQHRHRGGGDVRRSGRDEESAHR
jgi:hypothetical protein